MTSLISENKAPNMPAISYGYSYWLHIIPPNN